MAVNKVLNQRWLTNGPILQKFEKKFASYQKIKHAIGVSSATHGLHLALRALGIGVGDEVIVPTMTFAATADAVRYCGAKPILVDVDLKTFNIIPDLLKKRNNKKTKAVIPVHYGGQSCDMDEICKLAKNNGIKIIEDCAHSLGSTFDKKKCGSIGDFGCFSFYPTKIITTGEGGMVSTRNSKFYKKILGLRSHGMSNLPPEREKKSIWKYDIKEMGYNYRLDEIRASLGLSQFRRIEKINRLRIKIAKKYNEKLKNIKGITLPFKKSDRNHIYHLYTIKITKDFSLTRNELYFNLNKAGIGTSVQYTPLHCLSYNKKNYNKNEFSNSNKLMNQIISLPIYPTIQDKQIEYIISTIKKFT